MPNELDRLCCTEEWLLTLLLSLLELLPILDAVAFRLREGPANGVASRRFVVVIAAKGAAGAAGESRQLEERS